MVSSCEDPKLTNSFRPDAFEDVQGDDILDELLEYDRRRTSYSKDKNEKV